MASEHSRVAYLLTQLAEEAGEVVQEACKCIRFGLEDGTYEGKKYNALDRLQNELIDMAALVQLLQGEGLLQQVNNETSFTFQEKVFLKCLKVEALLKTSQKNGLIK